MGTTH
jgi:hypothetical protein